MVACDPLNAPSSTSRAMASSMASVVGSLPAASSMSLMMNALECECESVMTKASGPCKCEMCIHTNKETSTSVSTGIAVGTLSGTVSLYVSIHASNTLLTHPVAETVFVSTSVLRGSLPAPVSAARVTVRCLTDCTDTAGVSKLVEQGPWGGGREFAKNASVVYGVVVERLSRAFRYFFCAYPWWVRACLFVVGALSVRAERESSEDEEMWTDNLPKRSMGMRV